METWLYPVFKQKSCCFYHKVVNLFYMSIYNLHCYRFMKAFLPGHRMICPILWVLQFTLGQSVIHLLVYTPPPPPPYPFDCVILQVIVSLRASLKQLIISVVVTIHQNSPILNWSQIATSIDLLKCCYNLATLF